MTVPFMATSMESAMPADTMPAPRLPSTTAMASEAGRGEAAIAFDGSTYCTAAFTSMYRMPTNATPKIRASGNIAFRIANLAGDHVQVVPSIVSPQRRDQGGHEPGHSALGAGKAAGEVLPVSSAVAESNHHNAQDDGDFQEGEHQLKVAGSLDPDVIEDGNQDGCQRWRRAGHS